jgi:hypothetical protein
MHGIWEATQAELAKLRSEALTTPFLKRLLASLDESLNASAVEAEKRIESEGFRIWAIRYLEWVAGEGFKEGKSR